MVWTNEGFDNSISTAPAEITGAERLRINGDRLRNPNKKLIELTARICS
jgi:hypothetical protein